MAMKSAQIRIATGASTPPSTIQRFLAGWRRFLRQTYSTCRNTPRRPRSNSERSVSCAGPNPGSCLRLQPILISNRAVRCRRYRHEHGNARYMVTCDSTLGLMASLVPRTIVKQARPGPTPDLQMVILKAFNSQASSAATNRTYKGGERFAIAGDVSIEEVDYPRLARVG